MTEWRKTKKYNPSGPGYPEAGEYYVLMSEAEEKIEALEAEVANYLNNGDIKLRERIAELEAENDRLRAGWNNCVDQWKHEREKRIAAEGKEAQ